VNLSELIVGASASLTASTLGPDETAYVFVSPAGEGASPCDPTGTTCLGILNPTLLGVRGPDGSGVAGYDFTVPSFLADGSEVWFQAAIRTPSGTFLTPPPVSGIVSDGTSIVETCALDALDDTSAPDTANTVWMLEDSAFSLYGLTLGGSDGGGQDAADSFVIPVEDGCRVDVYATTTDDTSEVTASVDLAGTTTALTFGAVQTVDNATGASADVDVDLFLADTDTCFAYDLLVLYTCNDAPTLDAVAATVDGQDTCGTWTCMATASDADGDDLTLTYAWTVDGTLVGQAATLDGSSVAAGSEVVCTVTAEDDFGDTVTATASQTATAADVTVASVAIAAPGRVGETLTCEALVDSCDEATLTYSWTVDGADAGVTSDTLDTTGLAAGAQIACALHATDGTATATATSSTQVLAPQTLTLQGTSGRVGYSVAVMPDLDGDGYGVLAAGAPAYSELVSHGGRLYLVDGALDSAFIDVSDVEDGLYGTVFDGLNGDYDLELLACGSVTYVNGCPTNDELGDWDGFDGGPDGSSFGLALSAGGDMDGDGLPDLVATAPFELITDIWQGRAYVMSGATFGEAILGDIADDTSLAGFTVDAECGRRRDEDGQFEFLEELDTLNGDVAGYSATMLGDVNGDGLADMVLGAHNSGDEDRGMTYVVFGRDDGASVDLGLMWSHGCLGTGGTGAGEDLSDLGIALYGREDSGLDLGSRWGWITGNAGDFDGDGYADTLFTGQYETAVQILAGGPDGGLVDFEDGFGAEHGWSIETTSFYFSSSGSAGLLMLGSYANGGGDFNGDGFDDVIVPHTDVDLSAPFSIVFGGAPRGDVYVQDVQHSETAGLTLIGSSPTTSTERGSSVIVGDLDGDGLDDAAVGFPYADEVWVVYGRDDVASQLHHDDLVSGEAGFIVHGETDDAFGWSLAGGDLDGDGLADLVIGAPGDGVDDPGYAQVVFGRDLRGAITDFGGAEDDTLVGTPAADSLVGGHGDDVLVGNGGADVLYGGAGDDRLEVASLDFQRVRGGTGTDTLAFDASAGDVDLTTFDAFVDDIEVLELSGQAVVVPTLELLNLSTLSNQLDVTGTGTLSTVAGEVWTQTGTTVDDGTTYLVLTNGRATLRVDTALDTEIPPSGDGVGRDETKLFCGLDVPSYVATVGGDCDDMDSDIGDSIWYTDDDGDGYYGTAYDQCDSPADGAVRDPAETDCDETDPTLNPANTSDVCNGLDDDCDGTVDENCQGCTFAEDSGSGYLFCEVALEWDDAQEYCANQGGHLVTIDDADENAFVLSTSQGIESGNVWLGGNDLVTEGTWMWDDGSDLVYDNWNSGEPNDSGSNEDCMEMRSGDGLWNDAVCTRVRTFVCELRCQDWYADEDGDGYSGTTWVRNNCGTVNDEASTTPGEDCDDTTVFRSPGNVEVCDDADLDEDCNDLADDADPGATGLLTWHVDADGDGFGGSATLSQCEAPDDATDDTTDCDDDDPAIAPDATETCNGLDDNCDGLSDEGTTDADGDGTCDLLDPCPTANPDDFDRDGICDDDFAVSALGFWPGQTTTLIVSNAPASTRIYFGASIAGEGSGPCLTADDGTDVCAGLTGLVPLGLTTSDANGNAFLQITTPSSFSSDDEVWIQALHLDGSGDATPVMNQRVQ
jgi:hypothetical protein